MASDIVPVEIRGLHTVANGMAVFLGNDEKTFVIYIDAGVGGVLTLALGGMKRERPLTHDLVGSILLGLGARLERVVINDVRDGTFFARIRLEMQNEIARKILEVDARPSDSMVLAVQHRRPIFVSRAVLDTVEDMTEFLARLQREEESAAPEADTGEDDPDEGGEETELPGDR